MTFKLMNEVGKADSLKSLTVIFIILNYKYFQFQFNLALIGAQYFWLTCL